MSSTTERHPGPTSPRGRKPRTGSARMRPMSPAPTQLEEQIATILREANGQPLSLRQFEERLNAAGLGPLDTCAVRVAVWHLIGEGRAPFTARRYVKAVGAQAG